MSGARGKIHCYFGSQLWAESSRIERITFITSLADKLSLSVTNVSVKSTNLAVLFPGSSSPIKTVPWGDHLVGGWWPLVGWSSLQWWTQYLKYSECPTLLLPSVWLGTDLNGWSVTNYTKIVILIVIAKIGFQWEDWSTDSAETSGLSSVLGHQIVRLQSDSDLNLLYKRHFLTNPPIT